MMLFAHQFISSNNQLCYAKLYTFRTGGEGQFTFLDVPIHHTVHSVGSRLNLERIL